MSDAFNDWLDRVADGEKPTVESFARSALTDLPRITTQIRFPSSRNSYPPEVWEEMQAIREGSGG